MGKIAKVLLNWVTSTYRKKVSLKENRNPMLWRVTDQLWIFSLLLGSRMAEETSLMKTPWLLLCSSPAMLTKTCSPLCLRRETTRWVSIELLQRKHNRRHYRRSIADPCTLLSTFPWNRILRETSLTTRTLSLLLCWSPETCSPLFSRTESRRCSFSSLSRSISWLCTFWTLLG